MSFIEYIGWVALGYAFLVLLIETLVWRLQPPLEGALTLIVNPGLGSQIERRLDSYEFKGNLYVSSNHWFRAWYKAALANPIVKVVRGGVVREYRAEVVQGDEHKTVLSHYRMGFVLRLLCGFAPSKFLLLKPVSMD